MIIKRSGEWNTTDLDDDVQCEDSNDEVSSGTNFSATSYNWYKEVLEKILSDPQYKATRVTFTYDVACINGATDNEFLFAITEHDTHKFDNYDGLSTSPAVGPFGKNYVYTTTHQLIYSSSSIAAILPADYTITSLVCYCIRRVPAQDGLFALILWYAAKTIYWSQ